MKSMQAFFGKHSDIALVLLVLGVLVVLFAPIPSSVLDFLILTNFSFAFLILLLTFYMARPVEFSTFPSLLLIATLFRLSLNVAATRLILSDADAGKGALGMMLKDPKFRSQLSDTVNQVDTLITGVNQGKGTLGKLSNDDQAYTNLNHLLTASTDLVTTIRKDPKKYLTIHMKIF